MYYQKNLEYNKNNGETIKQLAFIFKEKKQYKISLDYFKRYMQMTDDPAEKKMVQEEIYFLGKN